MQYNGIIVDEDLDLAFVKHYHEQIQQLFSLYENNSISQEQLTQLQFEYFHNSYKEFYLQRVECQSDLIELV